MSALRSLTLALAVLLLAAGCEFSKVRVAGKPTRAFPVSWSGERLQDPPQQQQAQQPPQAAPVTVAMPPTMAAQVGPEARPLVLGMPVFQGRSARVAILEFRGRAVSQDVLMLVSDEVRAGALSALRGRPYVVMTRESMAAVLKDMGRSSTCEEGECEVETARNIGADVVVSGDVVKVEGVTFVTLKLHDTATGNLLSTRRCEGATMVELVHNVGATATGLFVQ